MTLLTDKFPECDSCVNREDPVSCADCDLANGYELDESLIDMDEQGLFRVKGVVIDIKEFV